MRLVLGIGEQPARRIPIAVAHGGAQFRGLGVVLGGERLRAECGLQAHGPLGCEQKLEIEWGRGPVRPGRWHAPGPLPRPVHVVPPRQAAERPVRLLMRRKEGEHGPHAGQHLTDEDRVVLVHPVVVQHPDPPQRERRNVLLEAGRRAAVSGALGGPRRVELLDGVAHEAAVPGHVERHQRLDARVARVLKLLVVRAIHVGLVRAEPRGAPAHVEDPLELLRAGVEARLAHERIAGRDAAQVRDGERVGLRLDHQPQVAVGAPPQRPEDAPGAAIGDEDILVAVKLLALDFVPVLLPVRAGQEQRFRVA